MRVLGICGSLRSGSYNRLLLQAAAAYLPLGFELELFEGLDEIAPYDEDLDVDPAPGPVRRLRAAIAEADAVVVATPEYNAAPPGLLKNALDWASRPYPASSLRGKPVAVVGASTGAFGAVWAQAELRRVLRAIGADVVETDLPVGSAHRAFAASGELADRRVAAGLAAVVGALVDTLADRAA